MPQTIWGWPTGLAILITVLNAAKPAVVDDTAYLIFARHLATKPLDPYGFELFWYRQPEPAMSVLLPPVVPYWLAVGMAVFGENLVGLKLWLFPFVLMFCHASAFLLRRFARGVEATALVLLAASPFVLPMLNVMLDLPAVALGLTAVAAFLRGSERRNWLFVILAGLLAALAAQTKYTMLVLPAVFAWYGLLGRRILPVLLAGLVAVGLFTGWELFLAQSYGTSHFLFHVRDQSTQDATLEAWVNQKSALWRPLLGFLGGLAGAWGLWAASALGVPRRIVLGIGILAMGGMAAVCLLPFSAYAPARIDLPAVVFYPFGAFVFLVGLATFLMLGFRRGSRVGNWIRRNRITWFLLGWCVLEVATYVALTPFPAGRRVIPLCVVLAFLISRLVSRVRRIHPERLARRGVLIFGIACGLGLFALDCWDSLAEKDLVEQSVRVVQADPGGRVWTQGHWGWQYYADRAGWTLIAPGRSALRKGDWVVLPVAPAGKEFYRPHHGFATFRIPAGTLEPVCQLDWSDWLAGRTIPTLYGGSVPVTGGSGPRLTVAIYRTTRDWVPERD